MGDIRTISSVVLGSFVYDNDEFPGWRRLSIPFNVENLDPFVIKIHVQSNNGYYGDMASDNIGFSNSCNYVEFTSTKPITTRKPIAETTTIWPSMPETTSKPNSWKPTPTTTQLNGQCSSAEQLLHECKEKRGRWAWTCTDPELLSAQDSCKEPNQIMNADGNCVEV